MIWRQFTSTAMILTNNVLVLSPAPKTIPDGFVQDLVKDAGGQRVRGTNKKQKEQKQEGPHQMMFSKLKSLLWRQH